MTLMLGKTKGVGLLLVSTLWSASGWADPPVCPESVNPELVNFLNGKAVIDSCFHSDDLRTNNPQTTPADNSITTLADNTTPLPLEDSHQPLIVE